MRRDEGEDGVELVLEPTKPQPPEMDTTVSEMSPPDAKAGSFKGVRKIMTRLVDGGGGSGVVAAGEEEATTNASSSSSKLVPFLCSQDSLGAQMVTKEYVVASSSCSPSLYGCCEAMYEPNLPPEELRQLAAKILLAAMDRDCLSGADAVVHVITEAGVTTHEVRCPSD